MENLKRMIKVLWIDDNPTEFDSFLDDAHDEGLDIEIYKTVEAGLLALQNRDNLYEAIILDANCKISDDQYEAPQLAALNHAIVGIYALGIKLPWFVYTGGGYEGRETLEYIIPKNYRNWDQKQWYNKPDDEYDLFKAIREAVATMEDSILMDKYPEAFKVISSQQLLELLRRKDDKDFERDEEIPNIIREDIGVPLCRFLQEKGIYPYDFPDNTPNLLRVCSKFYAQDKVYKYVPVYIQRIFHFLSEYANNGSHRDKVREDIAAGRAKHLNRTAVDAILNIFLWCSQFPVDDQEAMKPITNYFLTFKTEKDNGNKTC